MWGAWGMFGIMGIELKFKYMSKKYKHGLPEDMFKKEEKDNQKIKKNYSSIEKEEKRRRNSCAENTRLSQHPSQRNTINKSINQSMSRPLRKQ